jgi:UMF1 family MFS transporter
MGLFSRFFKGVSKKEALSWAFIDFANSSYTVLILSFVFPIYFKEVIAGSAMGDFYWGLIVSLSILAGGISAPIIGAIADHDSRRKRKFILFVLLAVLGTAGLYFTGSGTLLLACVLFIIANFSVEVSQSLSDSFLPQVSTKRNVGTVSGLGWGLGYLGGIVAMLLLRPLYAGGFEGSLESTYKLTLPLTALFFLVFSVPAFLFIREQKKKIMRSSLLQDISAGFRRVFQTLKSIRKYKNIAWFLVAFYFLNDALVTLFAFIPIYARTTISLSMSDIMVALLVAQLVGFVATIILGWVSDRYGSKKILLATVFLWCIAVALLAMTTTKTLFYIAVIIGGCIMGSSQAVARSWLSRMVPSDKRSEFFGFNGFASKVAATTGPLIFGAVSVITSNQRIALLCLLPFFIISFVIFYRIKEY